MYGESGLTLTELVKAVMSSLIESSLYVDVLEKNVWCNSDNRRFCKTGYDKIIIL